MKPHSMPPDVRRQLLQLRDTYIDRFDRLERERRRGGEALAADFAEQATERENDEVVDALSEKALTALQQIEHALQRADIGAWGVCEACGAAIGAARLGNLPQATCCAACAGQP